MRVYLRLVRAFLGVPGVPFPGIEVLLATPPVLLLPLDTELLPVLPAQAAGELLSFVFLEPVKIFLLSQVIFYLFLHLHVSKTMPASFQS